MDGFGDSNLGSHSKNLLKTTKREFYIDRERDDRIGPYKTWYENGRLKIERNYLHDSKHGLELSYNSDGTMKESGFFYHGTPDSCRSKVWV